MNVERLSYYDNLRFVLVVLVVLGHAVINHASASPFIPSFIIFIYLFHMPLFLFVSGLFFSDKNIPNRAVCLIAYILIEKYLMMYTNYYLYGTKEMYLFYEKELTWYLIALLSYLLITHWIEKLNPMVIFVVAVIIGCLEGYDGTIAGNQLISRLIVFYPFYYLGSVLSKEKIVEIIQKYRKTAVGIGLGGGVFYGA